MIVSHADLVGYLPTTASNFTSGLLCIQAAAGWSQWDENGYSLCSKLQTKAPSPLYALLVATTELGGTRGSFARKRQGTSYSPTLTELDSFSTLACLV